MARVNHIHKMLAKHGRNHDFIYVLCCFVVDTIRLIDLVGWRLLTQHEKNGTTSKTNNSFSFFFFSSSSFFFLLLLLLLKTYYIKITAVFHFWMKVGHQMNLQGIPETLEKAFIIVDSYVRSDHTARFPKLIFFIYLYILLTHTHTHTLY